MSSPASEPSTLGLQAVLSVTRSFRASAVHSVDEASEYGSGELSRLQNCGEGFVMYATLAKAVCSTDMSKACQLLRAGASPSDADGYTPLHIAADLGLTHIAKLLVLAGADLEARTRESRLAPLLIALENGRTATATALLNLGANPNAADMNGTTALEVAARDCDMRMMLELIRRGAHVDPRGASGWTPLHVATGFNHPYAISALVRFGANPNNRDDDGDTPLITACSLGYTDCVQQLIAGGADVGITTPVC